MWWRRKQARPKPPKPPGYGRQIWLRKTNPIEAVTGQFGDWGPVVGRDPGEVYEDEIDPAWQDPETAPRSLSRDQPQSRDQPRSRDRPKYPRRPDTLREARAPRPRRPDHS